MKKLEKIILFVTGILVGALLILGINFINNSSNSITGNVILNEPSNWLSEEDIQITDKQVIININDSSIISYSDVRSMEPYVNRDSMSIILQPEMDELEIGDVIIFQKNGELITHRIIEIGTDYSGIYYITQGDNNEVSDGKIRFEEIRGVVVGVLY